MTGWVAFWTYLPGLVVAITTAYGVHLNRKNAAALAQTSAKLAVIHDEVNGKNAATVAAALEAAQREQALAVAAAKAMAEASAAAKARAALAQIARDAASVAPP
jgi:hypothetical protein